MEQFVVESVGPAGRLVLVDGHGRVICEVGVVQHLEHLVSTNLKNKRMHLN